MLVNTSKSNNQGCYSAPQPAAVAVMYNVRIVISSFSKAVLNLIRQEDENTQLQSWQIVAIKQKRKFPKTHCAGNGSQISTTSNIPNKRI